jgi:enoyl-CoA hydratase/carnithine racemase
MEVTTGTVSLDGRGDGIFSLRLSNPAKRNALTSGMWDIIIAHLQDLARADCRAIVIAGDGDHFCSGADVSDLGASKNGKSNTELTAEGLELLRRISVPTIAAIRGTCLGGGLALALACDFQIADDTARLGIPAARLGMVFSVRQTRILIAQVGAMNAKKLLLSGQPVTAADAHAMGLVSEVCDSSVEERALALARTLTGNAPLAIAGSKKIILDAVDAIVERPVDPALEDAVQAAKNSHDHAEAKRAFAEKRKPVFSGR